MEIIVIGVLAVAGFIQTRRFVRNRLRYVDGVQNPAVPIVVGTAVTLLAAPVVWILPFVGAGTALGLGIGAGIGAWAGAKDVRRLPGM